MKLAIPVCALGLLLAMGCAVAQSVYRSVDANGKVSFSDRPPALSAGAPANAIERMVNADQGGAPLPYELRQIADRYPVALYTGDDCVLCKAGRSLLVARGIPFTERTVTTPEDSDALQRISGQKSLPVLSIGTQQLRGFSDVEWSQYLDAAGYPKRTLLPVAYRNAAALPLVASRAAPTPPRDNVSKPPAPRAPAVTAPSADNPAGIKF